MQQNQINVQPMHNILHIGEVMYLLQEVNSEVKELKGIMHDCALAQVAHLEEDQLCYSILLFFVALCFLSYMKYKIL